MGFLEVASVKFFTLSIFYESNISTLLEMILRSSVNLEHFYKPEEEKLAETHLKMISFLFFSFCFC